MEDEVPRMVKTPWQDEEIPFEIAAEMGTKKVITEHSTIGIIVTTDGTITDIPREDYVDAEARVVDELRALNKPFVIVLNSADVNSPYTQNLAQDLENRYGTPVIPTDCANLNMDDINNIFGKVLYEFPIERVNINFPGWIDGLLLEHPVKKELYQEIQDAFKDVRIIKQVENAVNAISKTEIISKTVLEGIRLGTGEVNVEITLQDELFYKVLTEISGVNISNEGDLFAIITDLAKTKKEYDKIAYALNEVRQKGYGIVTPSMDELILEEPEMVKQGSRFGVKLRAKAPSIHLVSSKRIHRIY